MESARANPPDGPKVGHLSTTGRPPDSPHQSQPPLSLVCCSFQPRPSTLSCRLWKETSCPPVRRLSYNSTEYSKTQPWQHIAHPLSSNAQGHRRQPSPKSVTANPPLSFCGRATRHAARRSPPFSLSGNCIAHSTAPDTARSDLLLPFTFQARLHELHKSTSSQLFRKRLPVNATPPPPPCIEPAS